MSVLKGIMIAFSTFSKIPMPQFPWEDKDMRYMFVGFPLIGIVIGGFQWGLIYFNQFIGLPELALSILIFVMPLFITGGIHLDGFIDTSDAIASYKSREERLAILKDSHVGAFGVMGVIILALLQIGGLVSLSKEFLLLYFGIYILSRTLSGLASLYLGMNRSQGSLAYFKNTHSKITVVYLWILLSGIELFYFCQGKIIFNYATIIMLLIDILLIRKLLKIFGGLTGDLAGYFLTFNEMVFVWILVILQQGGVR